jgi:hypothetical protein
VEEFSNLEDSRLVVLKNENNEMEKILLISHTLSKIFLDDKKKGFKAVDLTPAIRPELNNGKLEFIDFFNIKQSDHTDIVKKYFDKILSENKADYYEDNFMYNFDGDVNKLERCYFIAVENKDMGLINVFIKSYNNLHGDWTRIDVPVDLNTFEAASYHAEEMLISFRVDDDDWDTVKSVFFDLVTKKVIKIEEEELYGKLKIDKKFD